MNATPAEQGIRVASERARLGLSVLGLSKEIGVARSTFQRWEDGVPVPADALALLAQRGFDIQFIVTGVRSENAASVQDQRGAYQTDPVLAADELKLLRAYRALPEDQRATALGMIELLRRGAAPGGTVITGGRVAGRDYHEGTGKRGGK